ncbi:MAG: hypothetical protein Q4F55_03100 [Bacillota bacterium]|nr:hypothetical protein [Bacillota bacterium]
MKTNKKTLIIRIAVILILIVICAVMFVIGRGHTIYVDNKTIEYNGQEIGSKSEVDVYFNDELVTELYKGERTSFKILGQTLKFKISVKERQNSMTMDEYEIEYKIPYNMDGILFSVPAWLNELPEDQIMTEFVVEEVVDDSEIDLTEDMDITSVE